VEKNMTTILAFVAFAAFLSLLTYAACQYGKSPEIVVLGVFASDGTRLDRPRAVMEPARNTSLHIRISGPGTVTFR
jgi:hypothetical protein